MSTTASTMQVAVSSSTTSSSEGNKKKFACTFETCNKSFSRSEHLHRHSLNHKEGTNTCQRCCAHFRRRDLLDRHMVRHKEKDDEAGGEGLGHLATRKRLWRDADGKIINGRRPYQAAGNKKRPATSTTEPVAVEENRKRKITGTPRSTQTPRAPVRARVRHVNRKEPSPEVGLEDESLQIADVDQLDFLGTNNWNFHTEGNNFLHGSAQTDSIKQESGVSYNSPFTTMSYYSWLFENDQFNGSTVPASSASSIQNQMPLLNAPSYESSYASSPDYSSGCLSPTSLDPHLLSKKASLDEFLPLSILANGAATMRRHTCVENSPPLPTPPLTEVRRDSHHGFSSRTKALFDYDGSSLFSDLPDMYHGRASTSTTSSGPSSPLRTPTLPDITFGTFGEKFRPGSMYEGLRRPLGDQSLS